MAWGRVDDHASGLVDHRDIGIFIGHSQRNILGHQVGGGTGRDVATAGGAIAGAAIGNNVANNNSGNSYARDVRRCYGCYLKGMSTSV